MFNGIEMYKKEKEVVIKSASKELNDLVYEALKKTFEQAMIRAEK